MRELFLLLAGCIALASGFAPEDGAGLDTDFFAIGAWYGGGKYRAPLVSPNPAAEKSAWLADLQAIKALGFNSIKTWTSWQAVEATEGVYNLDALAQVLDLANSTGLKVIIQVYADLAPDWVGKKYPEASFVSDTGVILRSQGSPGHCFDHKGVREATLRYYNKVAGLAAAAPAAYAIDLWSEPHVVNWVWFSSLPGAQFCFCPSSLARFREWASQRYGGNLDALNRAWKRTFASWAEVEPPRFGTISTYTDYQDWMNYIADKLAADLRVRHEEVRAVDKEHLTTSHSASPSVFATPTSDYGVPDDFRMSKTVDYYGASFYFKHAMAPLHGREPVERALMLEGEYATSYGKGFFVGEMQAGQGATGIRVNDKVTGEDERDWIWSAVASGAKALHLFAYYPMSSGYESNGYGLINLDGTMTARAKAAGAVAATVDAYGPLLRRAFPVKPEFAILYNLQTYFMGGNTVGPTTQVRHAMQGIFRSLYRLNVPLAILSMDDITTAAALQPYKAVYIPFPLTLPGAACSAIAAFVAAGGTAIADARLGWTNENGDANEKIPGCGLDVVFGATEESLEPLDPAAPGSSPFSSFVFNSAAPPGMAGLKVSTSLFAEVLSPLSGSTVVATYGDGSAAAVVNSYGRGRTMLLGTFLGLSVEAAKPAPAEAMQAVAKLAEWAGVVAPVSANLTSGGGPAVDVAVKLLEVEDAVRPTDVSSTARAKVRKAAAVTGWVLVVANRAAASASVTLTLRRPARTGKDMESGAAVPLRPVGGSVAIDLTLQAGQVRALHLVA